MPDTTAYIHEHSLGSYQVPAHGLKYSYTALCLFTTAILETHIMIPISSTRTEHILATQGHTTSSRWNGFCNDKLPESMDLQKALCENSILTLNVMRNNVLRLQGRSTTGMSHLEVLL